MAKVVFTATIDGQFDVVLKQRSSGFFDMAYGAHKRRDLTWGQAASELGQCIMHAVSCNGDIRTE